MTAQRVRTRNLVERGALVELAPIREAYERMTTAGAFTISDLARQLGWTYPRYGYTLGKPDTSRVARALGNSVHRAGGRRNYQAARKFCRPERADELCYAMAVLADVDPVDLGL